MLRTGGAGVPSTDAEVEAEGHAADGAVTSVAAAVGVAPPVKAREAVARVPVTAPRRSMQSMVARRPRSAAASAGSAAAVTEPAM